MSHHNVTQRNGDIFNTVPRMKDSTKYKIAAVGSIAAVLAIVATFIVSIFR